MPFKWFKKKSSAQNDNPDQCMGSKQQKHQFALKCEYSQLDGPVYDVSSCNAGFLPDTCFTYCKLLSKTSLLLFDNNLSTLECGGSVNDLHTIEILDAHKNRISVLPSDIGAMKNLKKLDVSKNFLKALPNSFSSLKNLVEVNLKDNCFTNVPLSLCELSKLHTVLLNGNKIKKIPKDLYKLQTSLMIFSIDSDNLEEPFKTLCHSSTAESLLQHVCSISQVDYIGIQVTEIDELTDSSSNSPNTNLNDQQSSAALVDYLEKKKQSVEQQMQLEKQNQEREACQLDLVFKKQMDSKKQLSTAVSSLLENVEQYGSKKEEQQLMKVQLEKQLRETQNDEVFAFLSNTSNKECMLENMRAQDNNLKQEIEGIVEVKDSERRCLISDLYAGEKNTNAVLQEIISSAANKNATFVSLLEEQDKKLEELVSTAAESSAEIRRAEVLTAMQSMLAEAVLLEARAYQEGQKQNWVSNLIEESEHSNLQVEDLLSTRQADNKAWREMLLHDEECQAAAFKLLLLNNDLKRINLIRQIQQVEHELVRLSSLERRTELLAVVHDSTTMLSQRKTLAGLLKDLLSQKSEREQQLENWLHQMEDIHEGGRDAADYWLLQYQRLMDAKPSGLAEAEEQLEDAVVAVISAAGATDMLPILARHEVTFDKLMALTQEDAVRIGVGAATFYSIQRALQHYLASVKLAPLGSGDSSPSAPPTERDDCSAAKQNRAPSAPLPDREDCFGFSQERAPSAPLQEELGNRIASAPPVEPCFVEVECVICMVNKSTMILLPCGHVCACRTCCEPLTSCPMCRAGIYTKLFLGTHVPL